MRTRVRLHIAKAAVILCTFVVLLVAAFSIPTVMDAAGLASLALSATVGLIGGTLIGTFSFLTWMAVTDR
jgi:hypothetical protein